MPENYNPEAQQNEDDGNNLPKSSEPNLDMESSEPFRKAMAGIDAYMEGEIEKAKTPEAKKGVIAMLEQKVAALGEWINSAEDKKIIEEGGYAANIMILEVYSALAGVSAVSVVMDAIGVMPMETISSQSPLTMLPILAAIPLGAIVARKSIIAEIKRKMRELEKEDAADQYDPDMHDGTL